MSDLVARAEAALEGVTEGPWHYFFAGQCCAQPCIDNGHGLPLHSVEIEHCDARFIAAARTLVPELLAEVERWQDAVVELRRRDESATRVIEGLKREVRSGLAEVERLRQQLRHHQRAQLARLQRDCAMLRRQCEELLTTDVGEALTRNQELFEENQHLRAEVARLKGER